ncbi:hypothetical protein QBC46DRAFT_18816 [Diplogelasinospora grovesii]|uniref:Uncharacterized protein n=1 Tax=Diplogelasinospora grovesii TaxID=303347 RepID=A0AAN6N0S6_9PEZI|nr:hypothetical protein QBC46DRAFT_18816 [Diplogelasinospora grovesii]
MAPDEPPTFRCESPSPDIPPTRAIGACPELSRCISTASSISHGSATTEASHQRESLGSDISAFSRQSSGSYQSRRSDLSSLSVDSHGHTLRTRLSTGSLNTVVSSRSGSGGASRRRGYMRPQATDFAASARQRESVLSLGSIAHLQYYFARTGLLDGKGGQLARKRPHQRGHALDLSALDTSSMYLTPKALGGNSDHDSSYASMGSSPDLSAAPVFGGGLGNDLIVESPIEEDHLRGSQDEREYYSDPDFEELDGPMLPPTVSTYNHRVKPLPKPPSIAELKGELTSALDIAATAIKEAKDGKIPAAAQLSQPPSPLPLPPTSHPQQQVDGTSPSSPPAVAAPGWYEIQGMHILDVMTLAIRAAKIYYTSHDRPDRLDAIKSEKELRGELLSVMDVLKRMATRGFVGGMRGDEFSTMDAWIVGLRSMLSAEDDMEAAEAAERASWTWLHKPHLWEGQEYRREEAFMRAMLDRNPPDPNINNKIEGIIIPEWTPIDRTLVSPKPTPFLESLSNGLRLVQLHNCAVRKSRRRFGAIPTFHTDTQKPYRAADNLRYWIKAAELRWEVLLKVDALGLQYNNTTDNNPKLWVEFEDAILQWCRKVREEISGEVLQEAEAAAAAAAAAAAEGS